MKKTILTLFIVLFCTTVFSQWKYPTTKKIEVTNIDFSKISKDGLDEDNNEVEES